MAENSSLILLIKMIKIGKEYISACIQEDVTIVCVNRENKNKKYISFNILFQNNNTFWLQNETWEYFISNEDFQKISDTINNRQPKKDYVTVVNTHNELDEPEELETIDDGFGKEYEAIASMPITERIQHLKEGKNRLEKLIALKPRQEELITEALVDTTRCTIMHNHASLMNSMDLTNEEAKKNTQAIVDSTFDLVRSSAQLISSNIINDELMNTLVAKSNGTIIQHMTRVHLNGLAFLTYYNKLVSSSSAINKLRINFYTNYRPFYQLVMPDLDPDKITLEKVFHGGMRAVSEANFYNWAVGFLIHDIGKAAAVEYHEGESAYNRDIVVEHVKVGYNSVMNKTNYPRDAGLITGYHHEYYGDSGGYGYFRSYLDQYKKQNPRLRQDSCISFDIEPMVDCAAIAYFPAKVLEIIDVYDSITDPNRKYRKAMTPDEALAMMEEEFVFKHPKIDVILFDIFSKFIRESKENQFS